MSFLMPLTIMPLRIIKICSGLKDSDMIQVLLRYLIFFFVGGTVNSSSLTHSGPEVIKLFPCSTQLSMKFQMLISLNISRNLVFFWLS